MSTTDMQATKSLRRIPLSAIVVEAGHNPRSEVVEDDALHGLAATLKTSGLLQPIVVRRRDDQYVILYGERRYRAAALAGFTELDALVCDPDDQTPEASTERLIDSLVENDVRVGVDRLDRARRYARLKADGLTIKGIAERTGRPGRNGQRFVKAHLALLDLPEALHADLAAEAIPMTVVAVLARLAEIHPQLAELAVQRVLRPDTQQAWTTEEPITWAQLEQEPINIVSDRYADYGGSLPDGVFEAYRGHPVTAFGLSEKGLKDLAAYAKLAGVDPEAVTVRLDRAEVEQAAGLKALHNDGHPGGAALIAGHDVAGQIAADTIARALKQRRLADRTRQQRDPDAAQRTGQHPDGAGGASATPTATETPAKREQRLAAEQQARDAEAKRLRDEQAALRAAAESFNDQLGAAVFSHLSKVRVDDRVLRILTAIQTGSKLRELAMRGARYGMPGWVTIQETRGGKSKRIYLEAAAAEDKAREFLAGANTAGDVAGRALSLIVMAVFASQEAVAVSNRISYEVGADGMPWADDAHQLLDAVVTDNLGEQLLGDRLAQRAQQRQQQQAAKAAKQAAAAELTDKLARIGALSDDELAGMQQLVHRVYGSGYGADWMRRDQAAKAIAEEHKRREALAETPDVVDQQQHQRLQAALDELLGRLGDGLSLQTMTTEQLDELVTVAAQALADAELTAVLAAVDLQRARLQTAQDTEHPVATTQEEAAPARTP